jgi:hypothetical protein
MSDLLTELGATLIEGFGWMACNLARIVTQCTLDVKNGLVAVADWLWYG